MEYRVSELDHDVEAAHERMFPARDATLASKLHNGGLIARAVAEDGRIVGLNAFIRVPMKFRGETAVGYQSFDTLVDDSARGKGVFTGLVQAFYRSNHGGAVLYGFPNNNSATGFFGKLGWTRLGTPPFLIKPLRAGYVMRRIGVRLDFPVSFARGDGEPFRTFNTDATELWRAFAGRISCAIDRTSTYLNHRLSMREYTNYGRFRNGRLHAFVSTRIAEKHGGKIGYVMEAMGQDLSPLISGAIGHMREQGAEVALAWCAPWSPNFGAYLRAGFVPLPERVRPIHLNFGAIALGPDALRLDAKDWYLSYLDSDTV